MLGKRPTSLRFARSFPKGPKMTKAPPLFLVGFPRSGTTALAEAIGRIGPFTPFRGEGHFLYHFKAPLSRIMSGKLNPASAVFPEEQRNAFLSGFADCVDQFYRSRLQIDDSVRWVDKTPDYAMVDALPLILRLFPKSQAVLIYRHPIECVRSSMATWPDANLDPEEVARRWAKTHAAWRTVRERRSDRVHEIHQPELLSGDEEAIRDLVAFLGGPSESVEGVRHFLSRHQQINRPKGDNPKAATYEAFSLSPDQIANIETASHDELKHWPKLYSPLPIET